MVKAKPADAERESAEPLSFNARVYELVSQIPRGKVLSYGRVAAMLDVPRGARAVGWALRGLPDNSAVPWQRVVSVEGHIRTPCLEDMENCQRALLEAEGIVFDDCDQIDMARFLWKPSEWEIRALLDSPRPPTPSP